MCELVLIEENESQRDGERECVGRSDWNWEAFGESYGNLVQSALPGIYECDPSDNNSW